MNIGITLYGFCNGFFGRDDYETKVIVYETPTSICCIYESQPDVLTCANFNSQEEKQKYINEWSKMEQD